MYLYLDPYNKPLRLIVTLQMEVWGAAVGKKHVHESESEVAQSCPTLCDPTDCSLPGSPVHGSLQARILE